MDILSSTSIYDHGFILLKIHIQRTNPVNLCPILQLVHGFRTVFACSCCSIRPRGFYIYIHFSERTLEFYLFVIAIHIITLKPS